MSECFACPNTLNNSSILNSATRRVGLHCVLFHSLSVDKIWSFAPVRVPWEGFRLHQNEYHGKCSGLHPNEHLGKASGRTRTSTMGSVQVKIYVKWTPWELRSHAKWTPWEFRYLYVYWSHDATDAYRYAHEANS